MKDNIPQYLCPICRSSINYNSDIFKCEACDKSYRKKYDIPDFREKESYWCNVSKEKMNELIDKSTESNDWLETAKELIPEYHAHFSFYHRADLQFIWPISSNARVLDAGSMWGGVTLPLAQYCKEVYAVDQTIETLAFLNIRSKQMGIDNIVTTASPLNRLPFPDNHFDNIILNGVLEWVAFEQEVVLERHYGKKRTDKKNYSKNPREMQLDVLIELKRVLKNDGALCLAIENAIGWPYLFGVWKDNHMNLLFTSFLPRFLSNLITKWKLNCEYRTYTYTKSGLQLLLNEAGFPKTSFYGAFEHYINPRYVIPYEMIKYWKKYIKPFGNIKTNIFFSTLGKLFPAILLKYVSPSFVVTALKEFTNNKDPKLIDILIKSGVLSNGREKISIVKYTSRPEDHHTVNYFVYVNNNIKPKYFCKVCRDNKKTEIIDNEANNLITVDKLLNGTDLSKSYPHLIKKDTIDDVCFLLMSCVEGVKSRFNPSKNISRNNLKMLDRSINLGMHNLIQFQKITKTRDVDGKLYLIRKIQQSHEKINETIKILIPDYSELLSLLKSKIMKVNDFSLPLCAIHGDYDIGNILFNKPAVAMVDFEHFKTEGIPFYDLSHLIFNPLLISFEYSANKLNFKEYLIQNGILEIIDRWFSEYSNAMNIPLDILRLIGPIVVLNQKSMSYPFYRDPNSYPMYTDIAFKSFIEHFI